MAIFTAYDNSEILAALQDAAPHAEIHIDDKIAREHSANGNARVRSPGKFWHMLQSEMLQIFKVC